jgi:hypothetical protein
MFRKDQSMRIKTWALVAGCVLAMSATSYGQAVISSTDGINTVYLGINDDGSLNTAVGNVAVNSSRTGIAYSNATTGGARDATSPGCFCEGWGVSFNGTTSGYANVSTDGGPNNLTVDAPIATVATPTSLVHLTSAPGLSVSQAYTVEVPGALFRNTVTISNDTGATITDVKYVRVMDWDVPFTEFAEFVTIVGTATTTDLERSHDNGFNTANPLGGDAPIIAATADVDFSDVGPADHGAYFRFNFGSLDDGESITFSVFYGAAPSELAMLAALGLVPEGIELYSLGQSSPPSGDPTLGTPITYAFAFSGVGGSVVVGEVPEPATVAVWGGMIGLGSILAWRARRQRKNAA